VSMLINSSELRAAGFQLKEVLSPKVEASARAVLRTRGAGLRSLEGMDPNRFVLSVDAEKYFFTLKYIFLINLQKKKCVGRCPATVDGEDGKSV
jgi:hypothetical protein